ncbi:protein phosphatase 1 regulatory subunit 29 [Nothobranchius furzeri]|uniref:Extracellular leucine-rich repeat and fibronectin type III domain containing 2 n=2 Tax=Nothobranchius TaxID=28779 RepID=A0A1A8AGT2_NOTFU|nr:extracellular leucine-rich repeat and fibronectin type III domain containing 2 [Nothobranchius furzeri]
MQGASTASILLPLILPSLLFFSCFPDTANGDCWLIEGDKGYVWLAICSQNQPPYETIPQHINNTVQDLRLNENKLKAVLFSNMYRFTNLTDLNLTKNEISYVEDGAFAGQAYLQVLQLGYNKLTNLTEGMMRGLGRLQCLFLQHNLIEVIASNAFWECPSLSSIDLSSNKLARIDPTTFTVLSHLQVCELAPNPFHCGCDLYGFLTWLEYFNNMSHTYDRLQCETPREMFGYPLLSPFASSHGGRNAKNILYHHCRDGRMHPGMTSLPPDLDGASGIGPDMFAGVGPYYHQPTTSSSSSDDGLSPSIKLHQVSLSSASLLVKIPKPYSKMYILTQYNQTFVSDVMNLKNKKEMITLSKLKPNNNYTFCVASIRNSQRYNHTCLQFSTRTQNQDDMLPTPSTTTHYIMTIVGCLFGMLIILGIVYYCLRKKRMHDEKKKSICVKKTILEMRYGPEVAAAVANDPSAVHKLQEQSREHHQYQHHHGGKLSTSSSSGMLHSANTTSSRLSSIPQVEKMASAFSEAMATSKGNYIDVRTGGAGMERMGDGGFGVRRGEELRDDDGTDLGEDSDDDGRGSASEISTIAMEVDKVNQIINNCIDALKLDAAAVAASGASTNSTASSNPTSPPPTSTSSLTRGLIPLSPGVAEACKAIAPNKIPPPPPLPALNTPLSERPGISGGGFVVSPPYRHPPPATATRPIQRQMSADAAVVMANAVKKQSSTTSCGSMGRDRDRGAARVYSLDVPEPRSPDGCNQQLPHFPDQASPVGCGEPLERLPLVGSGSCGGGGGGCDSGGVGVQHQDSQKSHHYHQQQQIQQQQQQLEVQQDYHCSEHRHSVPALYYQGSHQGSPAQRVSFLKPLTRSRKDAASYSQLSPARHHSSYSGYSSSPEYSSESSLRIWERFRPYRKGPRDESCYVTAGNALRKKVQFAKGEDLHDILDYWKGVSAQQKL